MTSSETINISACSSSHGVWMGSGNTYLSYINTSCIDLSVH